MKKINQSKNSLKYIFKNNIWVTGYYLDKEIIGRTCILNNKEMVICIDENASPNLINFDDVSNLSKLNIIEQHIPEINKTETKITFNKLLNLIENSKN